MISDKDIWRSAQAMIKRYGHDSGVEASKRADELLEQGDVDGYAAWKRIMTAIEQLQAEEPTKDQSVH